MSPSRFILVLALLLAATLYGAFVHRTSFLVRGETTYTLVDDAMISMRYALHLSSGKGLVWNVNDPPVEGFTNLLWVVLMAGLHLVPLSASGVSLAVMLCSLIALLANLVVVWQIMREASPFGWFSPSLAVIVTALYFPLVFWSLRGMELGLVFLLLNLATLFVLRLDARPVEQEPWGLAATLSLTLMTRPDSMIQVAVLLFAGVIVLIRAGRASRAALLLGAVAATAVVLVVFRLWYFGDIFPNTYYLKMTGVTATERIEVGIRVLLEKSGPVALFLSAVVAGVAFVRESRVRRVVALLVTLFVAQTAYSVYAGGDFAEELVGGEGRFLAQGFGFLILSYSLVVPRLLAARISEESDVVRKEGVYLLIIVALGSAALLSGKEWSRWRVDNAPLLVGDIERARRGLLLEAGTEENAVIGLHAAGNASYYCRRHVIDLLGKSDQVIARGPAKRSFVPGHNKWDYDYAIGLRRPDIIGDEWPALWGYLESHPGEYEQLLPAGIFVRAGSSRVSREVLSRDVW